MVLHNHKISENEQKIDQTMEEIFMTVKEADRILTLKHDLN